MAKAPVKEVNKPVANFRIGNVKAAVWRNDSGHFNTTFVRSYKQGDSWVDGDSYGSQDLLNLAKVAERAEQFISEQD